MIDGIEREVEIDSKVYKNNAVNYEMHEYR